MGMRSDVRSVVNVRGSGIRCNSGKAGDLRIANQLLLLLLKPFLSRSAAIELG
ncbi:hypothetical protein D3C86_1925530 [compost metagenome]